MSSINERKKEIRDLYGSAGERHRTKMYLAILIILIVVVVFIYIITTNFDFSKLTSGGISSSEQAVEKTANIGETLGNMTSTIEDIESILG